MAEKSPQPDGQLAPSKWQVENKGKAKESFNRAANGVQEPGSIAGGKISETVRKDRPHMAPRPKGMTRGVETQLAYAGLSQERADVNWKNSKSIEEAKAQKQKIAAGLAKSLQKDGGMLNNKSSDREDDRGR